MAILLVLVYMDNSEWEIETKVMQFLFLFTTIVAIAILMTLNYSKVYFSRTTYDLKEPSYKFLTLLMMVVMGGELKCHMLS